VNWVRQRLESTRHGKVIRKKKKRRKKATNEEQRTKERAIIWGTGEKVKKARGEKGLPRGANEPGKKTKAEGPGTYKEEKRMSKKQKWGYKWQGKREGGQKRGSNPMERNIGGDEKGQRGGVREKKSKGSGQCGDRCEKKQLTVGKGKCCVGSVRKKS